MKAARRQRNIPMYAAGVLFCLTLLSVYWVSGLYAKYVTSGSAVDAARTAAFYLETEGTLMQHLQSDVIPGMNSDTAVHIINQTEVTMEYTLTIRKETDNLPLTMQLTKPNLEIIEAEDNAFVIQSTLAPGEQTNAYQLNLHWAIDDQSEPDSNLAYIGMVDYFTVTVDAAQVD